MKNTLLLAALFTLSSSVCNASMEEQEQAIMSKVTAIQINKVNEETISCTLGSEVRTVSLERGKTTSNAFKEILFGINRQLDGKMVINFFVNDKQNSLFPDNEKMAVTGYVLVRKEIL